MAKFAYVKEGSLVGDTGNVHRIPVSDLTLFLDKTLSDGTPKFTEAGFEDWSHPDEWAHDDDGRLVDPLYGALGNDGEPVA